MISFINDSDGTFSPYHILGDKEVKDMTVEEILVSLNDEKPLHYIETLDADSARMGEEMVKFGQIQDKSNRRISKYFCNIKYFRNTIVIIFL